MRMRGGSASGGMRPMPMPMPTPVRGSFARR